MFIVRIDYFTQSADLQKPFWFVMLRCSIYKVQSPLALASSFISLPHSISFVKCFFRFSRTFSWLPISLCDRHSREQLCQYIMSGSVCQELFSTFFKVFTSNHLFGTALSSARLVYYAFLPLSIGFYKLSQKNFRTHNTLQKKPAGRPAFLIQ